MNVVAERMADPTWIRFTAPWELAWHQVAIEVVVYVCFAATVAHAARQYRQGHSFDAFLWVVLFVYGVSMELVSFNFIQNYAHNTFSVQLYHGNLPVYITTIYMVFHYTGIQIVRRLNLPPLREALLAGLAIMLMDVPYDTLGPDAGWWIWIDSTEIVPHPRLAEAVATQWLDAPVTSYYWYMIYGSLLAIFSRFAHPRLASWPPAAQWAVAPVVSAAAMVAGALAFEVAFWTPRAIGLHDTFIVGVWFIATVGLMLTTPAPDAQKPERWMVAVPVAIYSLLLVVMAWLAITGELTQGAQKLAWITPGALLIGTMAMELPLRSRTQPAPVTASPETG